MVEVYRAIAHRVTLSWTLCSLETAMAALHTVPSLAFAPNPRTAVVVQYANTVGPGWVALFGLSAVVMALTLVWGRHRHVGHLPAVFTWVAYASGLWFGAINTGGPLAFPSVATAMAVVHLIVATAYAEDPERRRGAR